MAPSMICPHAVVGRPRAPPPPPLPGLPDCGVHYLWFAFVCFVIRSPPPPPPRRWRLPRGCSLAVADPKCLSVGLPSIRRAGAVLVLVGHINLDPRGQRAAIVEP